MTENVKAGGRNTTPIAVAVAAGAVVVVLVTLVVVNRPDTPRQEPGPAGIAELAAPQAAVGASRVDTTDTSLDGAELHETRYSVPAGAVPAWFRDAASRLEQAGFDVSVQISECEALQGRGTVPLARCELRAESDATTIVVRVVSISNGRAEAVVSAARSSDRDLHAPPLDPSGLLHDLSD